MTSNQASTFMQPANSLFSICVAQSSKYKGNSRNSPGTSIHNKWLVNLMYATVASCFACGEARSYAGVIMKRYFWQILHVFKQRSIWTPHTHLSATSNTMAVSPCLAILSEWGKIPSTCLLPLPPSRQSYAPSIIYTMRCFFHFNIPAQMAFWEASLLSLNAKSMCSIIYLRRFYLCLTDSSSLFFFLFLPSSRSTGPWLDGVSLSLLPNTAFLLATQQVSLFDHIIFIDSCNGLAPHCII